MKDKDLVGILRQALTEMSNNPAITLEVAKNLAMDDELEIIIDEVIAARIREDLKGFIDARDQEQDAEKIKEYEYHIKVLADAYEYFKILPEPQERYHNFLRRMTAEDRDK